jgi:hypothetical protein
MKIFVYELNEFRNLKIVGEYGIFHNPIVEYNGNNIIAEYYDLDTDTVLCQSIACSHCCFKGSDGCRLYSSKNVAYAI